MNRNLFYFHTFKLKFVNFDFDRDLHDFSKFQDFQLKNRISQKRLFRLSWFFHTSFLSIKRRGRSYRFLILSKFGSELILVEARWGTKKTRNCHFWFLINNSRRNWDFENPKKPFLGFIDRKLVSKNQPNRTNRSWDNGFLIFCWRQQKFPKNDEKMIFYEKRKKFNCLYPLWGRHLKKN